MRKRMSYSSAAQKTFENERVNHSYLLCTVAVFFMPPGVAELSNFKVELVRVLGEKA